jgi:hypothetical protein
MSDTGACSWSVDGDITVEQEGGAGRASTLPRPCIHSCAAAYNNTAFFYGGSTFRGTLGAYSTSRLGCLSTSMVVAVPVSLPPSLPPSLSFFHSHTYCGRTLCIRVQAALWSCCSTLLRPTAWQ